MENYDHLINDPKFKEYLKSQGYQIKPSKEYQGKIVLADKIERSLNWNFAAESFLRTMMLSNGIEELKPMTDMIHFSMVVYSMMIEDMVTNGDINDKYITFDELHSLLPTDAKDLYILVDVMNSVFSRNKREFMAL